MKQVDHPFHIEFIESFINKDNFFCFITKFASGGTLTKLINEKKSLGGFSENEALIYLAQMLLGIECMHSLDMIHRDLKPDNIFYEEQKGGIHIIKIGDFGSARLNL